VAAGRGTSSTYGDDIVCRRCQGRGHKANVCASPVTCFTCHLQGHKSSECKEQAAVAEEKVVELGENRAFMAQNEFLFVAQNEGHTGKQRMRNAVFDLSVNLPASIQKYIFSFLSALDRCRLSAVSCSAHLMFPGGVRLRGAYGKWSNADNIRHDYLKLGVPLRGPIVFVKTTIDWNDQGWGNQKGAVFLKITRNENFKGKVTIRTVCEFSLTEGVAPHARAQFNYTQTAELQKTLLDVRAGDELQVTQIYATTQA
jgi:hypothetical protein